MTDSIVHNPLALAGMPDREEEKPAEKFTVVFLFALNLLLIGFLFHALYGAMQRATAGF